MKKALAALLVLMMVMPFAQAEPAFAAERNFAAGMTEADKMGYTWLFSELHNAFILAKIGESQFYLDHEEHFGKPLSRENDLYAIVYFLTIDTYYKAIAKNFPGKNMMIVEARTKDETPY